MKSYFIIRIGSHLWRMKAFCRKFYLIFTDIYIYYNWSGKSIKITETNFRNIPQLELSPFFQVVWATIWASTEGWALVFVVVIRAVKPAYAHGLVLLLELRIYLSCSSSIQLILLSPFARFEGFTLISPLSFSRVHSRQFSSNFLGYGCCGNILDMTSCKILNTHNHIYASQ